MEGTGVPPLPKPIPCLKMIKSSIFPKSEPKKMRLPEVLGAAIVWMMGPKAHCLKLGF
jgi:hypothetical protein